MVDPRQEQWQRDRIEWVFGILGGELETVPWDGYPYWYDGAPDYADELKNGEYRTIIRNCLFDPPPDEIEGWKLIQTFSSSGETECPGKWFSNGVVHESDCVEAPSSVGPYKVCPYCEQALGMEHSMIYLGDGWLEAVYQKTEDSYEL